MSKRTKKYSVEFFLRMKCMLSDSHGAIHRMWENVMSSTMKAVLGQVHLWSPVRRQ